MHEGDPEPRAVASSSVPRGLSEVHTSALGVESGPSIPDHYRFSPHDLYDLVAPVTFSTDSRFAWATQAHVTASDSRRLWI